MNWKKDWKKELKEGDEVVIHESNVSSFSGLPKYAIDTVTKVTKTQLLVGKHRYLISSGYRYGSMGLQKPRLLPATPEMKEWVDGYMRYFMLEKALRYLELHKKQLPDNVIDLVMQAYDLSTEKT